MIRTLGKMIKDNSGNENCTTLHNAERICFRWKEQCDKETLWWRKIIDKIILVKIKAHQRAKPEPNKFSRVSANEIADKVAGLTKDITHSW
jgi:hypothetical protein